MDCLQISSLKIMTHIGVHAFEQKIQQVLLLDISIPMEVIRYDNDLNKTIDYSLLCEKITTFVENNHFVLIETVAEQVALLIKEEFAIKQVTVKVSKPSAIPKASNVAITLTR